MVQKATKSSEFIEIIQRQGRTGTPFDDFAARELEHQISQLPDFAERYETLGILYGTQQNADKTEEFFEKALRLSSGSHTLWNYSVAIKSCGELLKSMDLGFRAAEKYNEPKLIAEMLPFCSLLLDIDLFTTLTEKLEKLKADPNQLPNRIQYCLGEYILMTQFIEQGLITKEQLRQLGEIATQVANSFKLADVDNQVAHMKERPYLSIDYRVFAHSVSSETVTAMNMKLIDKLIENDLDGINAVVQFIRAPEAVPAEAI